MKKTLFIIVTLVTTTIYAQNQKTVLNLPFSGNAKDISGNGFQTIVNGAILAKNRFHHTNQAYKFDGKDDFIEILEIGNRIPTDEITVSMWVKSYRSQAQFQLMLYPDKNRFAVSVNYFHAGQNTIFWDFGWTGAGGDAPGRLYFRPEPFDTLWHHYVFTSSIENRKMKVYKDNQFLIEKNQPLPLVINENKKIFLGYDGNKLYFNGLIDDIKIYNTVIAEKEIDVLFKEPDINSNIINILSKNKKIAANKEKFHGTYAFTFNRKGKIKEVGFAPLQQQPMKTSKELKKYAKIIKRCLRSFQYIDPNKPEPTIYLDFLP